MRLFAALLWLLATAPPLGAADAQALFAAGRFAEAAAAGQGARGAAALVAAGRAASTEAGWRAADRARAEALLVEAEALFDRALALEPGNGEALLQRAIATGYRAKLKNAPGLAREARRGFEQAIARNPQDALAHAALGGWHGEAVATLGRLLAGTALGASRDGFERSFERAMALNPEGPAIPTFFAFTALALDAGNARRAEALLERADRARAADGFERLVQANARAVLALLQKGDVAAARREAARRSPLGQLG
jgi:tetratricopeptide (TPR) repeat protein